MNTSSRDGRLQELAELLHALWCRRRQLEGWERGREFDQETMLHDALVPFADLKAIDRRDLMDAAEDVASRIDRMLRYQRGSEQQCVTSGESELPDELKSIVVFWPDGSVTEQDPRTGIVTRIREFDDEELE